MILNTKPTNVISALSILRMNSYSVAFDGMDEDKKKSFYKPGVKQIDF